MEEWRDIKGYEDKYQVSNLGRVKALKKQYKRANHIATYPEKILKVDKTNRGYLRVTLVKDGVAKHYSIHRLVASAFLGCENEKLQVNHKNGNKEDNRLDNLEWCTRVENMRHAWEHGLSTTRNLDRPVYQLDVNTEEIIGEYPSIAEVGRKLGINTKHIGDVCRGKRKTSHGFKWRYKEVE